MHTQGEAAAIIEVVQKNGGVALVGIGVDERGQDIAVASVPGREGRTLQSVKRYIDEYRTAPERIEGHAFIHSERSFVAYTNRFRRPASAVFLNETLDPPEFTAVFDYHDVAQKPITDDGTKTEWGGDRPAFGSHRATWRVVMSDEWDTWHGSHDEWQDQPTFAEFLEENVIDVYSGAEMSAGTAQLVESLGLTLATSAALVALSRDMQVNVNAKVQNAQTLSSGEIRVTYTEQHTDGSGSPLRIPNAFLIAIPVIKHGPRFQMLVRLRYRVTNGVVRWGFLLHRADQVRDSALTEVLTRVGIDTGLPLFRGTPA
jgi:hypothetical protein